VLLRYEFVQAPASAGLVVGPLLSIPVGDIEMTAAGVSTTVKASGITFGITAGLFAGYPVGPGRIVGDARFLSETQQTARSPENPPQRR
jgi:hypothetical protein